ncbi:MAG TPA: TonB-dependent receptor [Prolixibacteraceae bacterium]|nr:TonB-dependent receptor [Prolixibacteraceae bacterium]
MKKKYLFLFFLLITISAFSQRYTISGFIVDKESGESLISANIYDAKTLRGTTANTYGFYSISLPAGDITLIASFIGYTSQEFKFDLKKDITLNIELALQSDQLDEVTVYGNQVNKVEEIQMSMAEISVEKFKKIPVILGEADVLKVLQLLPGVQSGTEGTSGIYVRGGGPDQNLFLLDGVPVYNASHLMGFFSVFNPDAIKTVKLYKGGFPSRFGGRLSSVVDISMKEGNMKEFKGDFSIGLISSKLMFEGPIIKDKTSFMISGRRTYLDILSKPIIMYANMMNGNDNHVSGGAFFHDYNLKVNHIFNERSRLYLSGYFGKDKGYIGSKSKSEYLDYEGQVQKHKNSTEVGLSWGNTIASLRWNYLLSKKLFSNSTFTYSKYIFDVGTEFINEDFVAKKKTKDLFKYYSGIQDWAAKVDFDYFPSPNHDIKFGASFIYHRFTPGATRLQFESIDLDELALGLDTLMGNNEIYANELGFFAEDEITITNNLKVNAGVHLSVFLVEGVSYVRPQPRLSLRYKATERWALKASYSRMAQHVHLLTTAGISMPTDLWLPVTKKYAPPLSDQVALGTAINFDKGINLTVEGFYKTMSNLIEYKEGASFMGSGANWESKVEKGEGWSYGLEMMLEKTIGKTTGWIGYTWSKTERQFDNLNFGNPFPATYDRRHDISVAFTHEFSEKFDIGGTWVYGTGNAVTLAIMEYPQSNIPDIESTYRYNNSLKEYEGRNNYRMPAYHRMDLGANFHKKLKRGIRTWSISVYNLYNHHNPFILMWGTKGGEYTENPLTGKYEQQSDPQTILKQVSLFPIIPSISYSFKF